MSSFAIWILFDLVATSPWFADRVQVSTDIPHLLYFRCVDESLPSLAYDSSRLRVDEEPVKLEGRDLGVVRITALSEGETNLSLGRHSIQVCASPGEPPRSDPGKILCPVEGAAVWGHIHVRVSTSCPNPELLVGSRSLTPSRSTPRDFCGKADHVFEVEIVGHEPGNLPLTLFEQGEVSDRRTLTVISPKSSRVFEAEDSSSRPWWSDLHLDELLPPEERRPLPVRADRNAKGEEYVALPLTFPPWTVPFEAPHEGLYQVVIRARGHRAGGEYPSVHLFVDRLEDPRTSATLVDDQWHRLPLGRPFFLTAGRHHLGLINGSEYDDEAGARRRMDLDQVEIVSLPSVHEGDGSAMSMMSINPKGSVSRRVAFARPLHGTKVQGPLEVEVSLPGIDFEGEPPPPPLVTLWIDDRAFSSQASLHPRFEVPRSAFAHTQATLRLESNTEGHSTFSVKQVVTVQDPLPGDGQFHRLTVHDPRLRSRASAIQLETIVDQDFPERRALRLRPDSTFEIPLPETLEGLCEIRLEGRTTKEGPLPVTLRTPQGDRAVETEGAPWFDIMTLEPVKLGEGKKSLILHGVDLDLQAVTILTLPPEGSPPRARLLYPPPGHLIGSMDGILLELSANSGIAHASIEIDGNPRGTYPVRPSQTCVLPLHVRDLAPGDHRLTVEVVDHHGQSSRTPTIKFAYQPGTESTAWTRAIKVLDRFAYGFDREQIHSVLRDGPAHWLRQSLTRETNTLEERAALDAAMTLFPSETEPYAVIARAVHHALITKNPARTRIVHWIDNHFSTWIEKTGPSFRWEQFETFLEVGPARFSELLRHSARSPSMLRYLDQDSSLFPNINENYARELLELHTLGVEGGYDQNDVTRLASILSGYGFVQTESGTPYRPHASFRFLVSHADRGVTRQFLGANFSPAKPSMRLARTERALDLAASHPSTATFISRKIAEHYTNVPAPQSLVDELQTIFHQTSGDLKALLLALVESPGFWAAVEEPRVTHPLDHAQRFLRGLGVPDPGAALEFLERCDALPFNCRTPDGYPEEDSAYVDSNQLTERWRLAQAVEDVVWHDLPFEARDTPWPLDRLGDEVSWRLTGRALSAPTRRALSALDQKHADPEERSRQVVAFVLRTPDLNLK